MLNLSFFLVLLPSGVVLDFEKCVLRIETVRVPTIPNLIRNLCAQNRLILYGLLVQSVSDPFTGRWSSRGGGGLSVRLLLKGEGQSKYISH